MEKCSHGWPMNPACKTVKHKKIFPFNAKNKSVMIWMEAGSLKWTNFTEKILEKMQIQNKQFS